MNTSYNSDDFQWEVIVPGFENIIVTAECEGDARRIAARMTDFDEDDAIIEVYRYYP